MVALKKFLSFTKGERVAIIAILVLFAMLLMFNFFYKGQKTELHNSHDLDSLIAMHQASVRRQEQTMAISLEQAQSMIAEINLSPFPFNPNNLSEEDAVRMGLSQRQISNIKKYLSKGGRFYRKEDLKKIYSISEDEYAILEPYIVIPEVREPRYAMPEKKKETSVAYDKKTPVINVVSLNEADSLALVELPNVSGFLAARIVKYRELLGGFVCQEQLLEVRGMDSSRYEAVSPYIKLVVDSVATIDVNRDEFKTLLRHPYLDYEMVKAIVRYRESKGMVRDWEHLLTIVPQKTSLNPNLISYVTY